MHRNIISYRLEYIYALTTLLLALLECFEVVGISSTTTINKLLTFSRFLAEMVAWYVTFAESRRHFRQIADS